jgi:hypothetical protein
MWVLTLNSMALRYSSKGLSRAIFDNNFGMRDVQNSHFLDIHCDRKGNIWLASENEGLFVKHRNSQNFRQFSANPKDSTAISSNTCLFVFSDSKDRLWVGTRDRGLNLYDEPSSRFIKFTKKEGLLDDNIVSMVENKNGDLWVVSPVGISSIREKDGQFAINHRYLTSTKRSFAHLASLIDPYRSTLYLGSNNGIVAIDLKDYDKTRKAPKVIISNLVVQNIQETDIDSVLAYLNSNNSITFDKKDAFVSFSLASSILSETQSAEFSYTLKGFENAWHYLANGDHTVTYIGLPEGKYQLLLKTKTSFSDWSDLRVLDIRIVAPFTESKLFNYLIVLVFFLLVLASTFFAYRQAESRKAQKVLERKKEDLEKSEAALFNEVTEQNAELMVRSAEMSHHKILLSEIQRTLTDLYAVSEGERTEGLKKVVKMMNKNLDQEGDWELFRYSFDQLNQNFSQKIAQNFPHLTQNDIRLCVFIRLNVSTSEICKLLNVSQYGVQKSRFRLKKKLNLTKEDDLHAFIATY